MPADSQTSLRQVQWLCLSLLPAHCCFGFLISGMVTFSVGDIFCPVACFLIRLACLALSGICCQHCTGAPAPSTGCTSYKRTCRNKHDFVLNSVGAPIWNEFRHNVIGFGLVWTPFGLHVDSVWTRFADGFPYLKLEMQNHCWTSFGLGLDSDWTRPKRFDPSISGD